MGRQLGCAGLGGGEARALPLAPACGVTHVLASAQAPNSSCTRIPPQGKPGWGSEGAGRTTGCTVLMCRPRPRGCGFVSFYPFSSVPLSFTHVLTSARTTAAAAARGAGCPSTAVRMDTRSRSSGTPCDSPNGRTTRQKACAAGQRACGDVAAARGASEGVAAVRRATATGAGVAWCAVQGPKERKKERKTYARCQACVKGALASKSHRGSGAADGAGRQARRGGWGPVDR
jgi:hypothetical protein